MCPFLDRNIRKWSFHANGLVNIRSGHNIHHDEIWTFSERTKPIEILDVPKHVPPDDDRTIHAVAASAIVVASSFPRSSRIIVPRKFHPGAILDDWPAPRPNVEFDIPRIVHSQLITAASDYRGVAIGHVDRTKRGFGHVDLAISNMLEVEGRTGAVDEHDYVSQIPE